MQLLLITAQTHLLLQLMVLRLLVLDILPIHLQLQSLATKAHKVTIGHQTIFLVNLALPLIT